MGYDLPSFRKETRAAVRLAFKDGKTAKEIVEIVREYGVYWFGWHGGFGLQAINFLVWLVAQENLPIRKRNRVVKLISAEIRDMIDSREFDEEQRQYWLEKLDSV